MERGKSVSLQQVAGQDRVVEFFKRAIDSGRVSHAYLLIGPDGVGRKTIARAVCKRLLCDSPFQSDSCGGCRHCRLFDALAHPDHVEVSLDTAQRQEFPIELVREKIIEVALHKPMLASRRTFIIGDVDKFSLAAANCFLKTLEEPPGGAIFMLIAGSTQRIPETIISRCQTVRLSPLRRDEIKRILTDAGCAPEETDWLSRFACGSPGRAFDAWRMGLFNFYKEIVKLLDPVKLSENLRLTDFFNSMVTGAESAMERRRLLIELLECVLFYYREQLFSNRDWNILTRITDISDIIMENIQAIESNANPTLAMDVMWTRIAISERDK